MSFVYAGALCSFAVPQSQRDEAKAELTMGVKAIDAPGGALPGGFVVIGDDAFPVTECRNYDGTASFTAVGAFYGKGRALLLSHGNFVSSSDFKLDTKRLLLNAIRWEAPGKAQPKIAALRDGNAANMAKVLGFENVTRVSGVENLKDYDILLSTGIQKDDVPAILDFVKNGGGIIAGSLGWGYMYFNPNACYAEDFPDNRLSGTLGAVMGMTGVNRIDGKFPVVGKSVRKGTLVDEAIDLVISGATGDKAVRAQVAKTLSDLMTGLPSGVRSEVYGKLLAIAKRPDANIQPSPERPLGAESLFARLAILARKNNYLAHQESVQPADPAAAVYPGLVKPGTPSITRKVEVDLSVPRWHSTGVYSPAGRALTVKIDPASAKLGLKVRIGTTQDDISGAGEWKRFPLVTMELPLVKETTTFASPFGGMVYIVVPAKPNNSSFITRNSSFTTVVLDGGVMAPWFKLGRDTNEKFIAECAESGAPWGEIEGHDFIITSETRGLRRVKDPQWIATYWDKVMKCDQELACWKTRSSPERITADVQLVAGWLHDGYPLMSHINEEHFDWAIDKEGLESGDGWGVYHEIGHNHQSREWTPDGTGEVTVNLFTMYDLETLVGANMRDSRYACGAQKSKQRVSNWVKRGKKFDDWKRDYFLALEMYLRIKEAYGWDAYKKTFARYYEPGFKHPHGSEEIWNTFACELSKTVNADMGAALAEWSIPLSAETRKFCAQFPPAKPSITANLTKKKYVPPATEPISGEYLSVLLDGPDAGEIRPIRTRAEIPGGEKDRRWKTTHLLMRRIEPSNGPVTLGRIGGKPTDYEAPHQVEITKPYYIGVYELTEEQYFHIMGAWRDNCFGAAGDCETRPVNGISYDNVRGSMGEGIDWPNTGHEVAPNSFLGRIRELVSYRAEFDLPTEAQWEYAGRAGVTNDWNNGENGKAYDDPKTKLRRNTAMDKLGRYACNGGESTKPGDKLMQFGVKTPYGTAEVGSYAPNNWGLYDFHGNVYELCLDYLQSYADAMADYSGKDPVGPKDCGINKTTGKKNDARRAMRGGTWWNFGFGSADNARIWNRGLGGLCGTGTGHGATGFRLAMPAAVAPHPVAGPDAEVLTPAQFETRKEVLHGVGAIDSKGLPGPVYCVSSNAFPLVAALNWDNSPACLAAIGTFGKGRVAVFADDTLDSSLADNGRFFANLDNWLTDGSKSLGFIRRDAKHFDLATLPADGNELAKKIDEIVRDIEGGAGYLFYGRAWPWRQATLKKSDKCRISEWPGNRLLSRVGLMVGDFCVKRTAGETGWLARTQCGEGAAAVPSAAFDLQKAAKDAKPLVTPLKEKGREGILVKDGETIAFLGDSITRLGANPKGYINLVLKGLEVAGVRNVGKVPAGCDGQNAGDMLGRIGGLIGNADVKIITISCGVNDVWGYDWGCGVQLEDYERNVRRMYDKAAAAGVQVVAMTPTLIREVPDNEYNRVLDPFADFIRAEAKLRGLPLADCRKAEIEALAKFPPDSGKHFTYDGVHPVWEGNKLIAREILRALGVPAKYDKAIEEAWRRMGGRYDMTVRPARNTFDNFKSWSSLFVNFNAGSLQWDMVRGLRSDRNWRLNMHITDETTENTREFNLDMGDMDYIQGETVIFPLARYDYILMPDHAYTVELTAYEGGNIRAQGKSEKGAFKVFDKSSEYVRLGRMKAEVRLTGRPQNALTRKNVLFAGDDIMAATCETKIIGLCPTAGWPGRIGWANNMHWMNAARDGAMLTSRPGHDTLWHQLDESQNAAAYDLVILEGGLIDALNGVEIGNLAPGTAGEYHMPADVEKTFSAALERVLWRATNNRETKVGFVIPPRIDAKAANGLAERFAKFVPVIRKACEKWGVAYCDLWDDASVTEMIANESNGLLFGGMHLNNRGYDATLPYVQQFAEAVLSGAAEAGVAFKPVPVAYAEPSPDEIGPSDVNVAAGKMGRTKVLDWRKDLTDGDRKNTLCIGGAQNQYVNVLWTDCYAEIDLGGVFEIDKVRIFPGASDEATRYKVLVTDDGTRPANNWRQVWEKRTDEMCSSHGFSGSFKPVEARYVRVYGMTDYRIHSAGLAEVEVFGKPLLQ